LPLIAASSEQQPDQKWQREECAPDQNSDHHVTGSITAAVP
jgi:hypothetical protein